MTGDSAQTLSSALKLHQSGQVRAAEQLYRQILAAEPRHVDALNLLGAACLNLGQTSEAIGHLQKATQFGPNYSSAHDNLGVALASAGRFHEAASCFRRALELNPNNASTMVNLGSALSKQGLIQEAAAAYFDAVRMQPGSAPAHYELGNTLAKLNRMDAAVASLREAIRLRPKYSEAWNNLGNLLNKLGQLAEAERCFRQAIAIKPNYSRALANLGVALTEQGRLDEAVATLEHLVQIDPTFAEGHNNLGVARMKQGRLDEALADFETSLRLKPDYAEAPKNRAIAWLQQGDYARGWPAFESRWQSKEYPKYSFNAPVWDGSPLAGRTILLHAEQGLGDTMQFVRYAPLVQQRGGRVIVQAQRPLLPLLSRSTGIDQLIAPDEPIPAIDCYASLMSLPALLGTTMETVPHEVPYLATDPLLVEKWKRELAAIDAFKVAIAWQGNPDYRGDHLRSIPLREFAPLAAVSQVRLLSLQRGHGAEQLAEPLLAFNVQTFDEDFDRSGAFLDTAAVMQAVDLVVTSDTAIAHLAGALGVPVWVPLPYSPDWRWMLERSDSPWYPTMRLFRQKTVGRWDNVFAEIADALRDRVNNRAEISGE
jgi:tetratricopeptide (TPR) repeat protein